MKTNQRIDDILLEWAENVRDEMQDLKHRIAFCEADYKLYQRWIKDPHAVIGSPQHARLIAIEHEYIKKSNTFRENIKDAIEMFPHLADVFQNVF